MVNWLASMQQTFEFYTVDPISWKNKELLTHVTSCTIDRDLESETLCSAKIDTTDILNEEYIRIYLVTNQNGSIERHPLGTFLFQSPSLNFDGKISTISSDGYSPLIELKEKYPPIGYYEKIKDKKSILEKAYTLTQNNVRSIAIPTTGQIDDTKNEHNFISNIEDTWMVFISDLLKNAEYKFDIDELGQILFKPDQKLDSLKPLWTYDDSNSSILQPKISLSNDIYNVPNVLEVIYSNGYTDKNNNVLYYKKISNDDPNSTVSTKNRGREIVKRITDPPFTGRITETEMDDYAKKTLKELSTIEYSVTYTHGYCPVRIGDCIMINYEKANLKNIKAKVISQSIKCTPGCLVTEKAVFSKDLWRG